MIDGTRRTFVAGAGAAAAGAATGAQAQPATAHVAPPADLILKNGKVITVDGAFRIAPAIAVSDERIVAVGSNEDMAAHTGPMTHVIDLRGRAVVPGLIDGHAHMDREALRAVFPSLGPVRSIRDIQDRIAELARGKRPGEWIVTMPIGEPPYYFDVPGSLAEKRWPTRHELDQAAPDNPVYIRSIWGYWRGSFPLVSIANTKALKRAGITRATVSPVESLTIERDANGDPTGVFVEGAVRQRAGLTWLRSWSRLTYAARAV